MKHLLLFSFLAVLIAGCATTKIPRVEGSDGLYYEGEFADTDEKYASIFVYDKNGKKLETIQVESLTSPRKNSITLKGKDKAGNTVQLTGNGC